MNKRITIKDIQAFKERGEQIVCLTAYDAIHAAWAQAAGAQLLLVGDSMGNTVLGYENTLPVTLEQSLAATAAVRRGAAQPLVVGDMPFLTYQLSIDEAVRNAGRYLKECGADAVKLEGGRPMFALIRRLVDVGIPVMAHIGLLPQSLRKDGGYRLHGKEETEAEQLVDDARAVQEAGAFSVVLEGIPAALAARITAELAIPTIGIAAGPHCDGQIQVITDVLGMTDGFVPKHAMRQTNLFETAVGALRRYAAEVKAMAADETPADGKPKEKTP